IPRRPANPALDERAHLDDFGALEEQSARSDELERVPLDGIVTRRDHEATGGVMVLDRKLAGWRGREADVDDVAADGLQRREHDAVEQRTGDAAVTADDDLFRGAATQCPGAERGRVRRDDLRR